MKTVWIVLGIVVVVGAAVLAAPLVLRGGQSADTAAAASAELTEVTRGSIEATIGASGKVVAEEQASLSFETSGRVTAVWVEAGQYVEAGQPLAMLDDRSLQDQVARAEAALATAQTRLAQAETPPSAAELAAASAAVASAQANLDKLIAGPTDLELRAAELQVQSARDQLWGAQAQRDSTGGTPGHSAAQEDSAEAQVHVAETAVEQALVAQQQLLEPPSAEELAVAQSQVDQAQAQLDQLKEQPRAEDVAVLQAQVQEAQVTLDQARAQLDNATLTAPFAGTVASVAAQVGEWSATTTPAVVLARSDVLRIQVNVDEMDVVELRVGQTAHITFDALPGKEITGQVQSIAPSASTSSSSVAYQVEVTFDPGDLPVRLGMTADVDIVTARVENALLVPVRALTADRSTGTYWATRRSALGQDQVVEVQIGLRNEQFVQITEGLDEGDTLVLDSVPTSDSSASQITSPLGVMRGLQ